MSTLDLSERTISGRYSRSHRPVYKYGLYPMRTPLYTVEPSIPTPWNEDTSVYSGTPLFQWGHLCIQWNSSIPTPWNEDTSVCSGTLLRINVWQAETWQESQLVRGEGKTDFDLNKILMCSDWTCACQNGIKCFVLVFAGSLLVLLLVVELASTNPSIKKMEIPLY